MVVTKYRRPPRICVPFQIPDDLRRRIFRRYLRSTYGGDPASDDDFIPVAVKLSGFAPAIGGGLVGLVRDIMVRTCLINMPVYVVWLDPGGSLQGPIRAWTDPSWPQGGVKRVCSCEHRKARGDRTNASVPAGTSVPAGSAGFGYPAMWVGWQPPLPI